MSHEFTPQPHRPPPANATWVVVADAGRARIFSVAQADGVLEEVVDFVNPDARLQDHDTLSARRGHVNQGPGGIGHAFEPRETHAEHVAETFAKDLCHRLGVAQQAGQVARIYLLAAPRFLGLLRQNFDAATHKLVVQELAVDLTRHAVAEIRSALPKHL
jgi:protein required for attachment to host cells